MDAGREITRDYAYNFEMYFKTGVMSDDYHIVKALSSFGSELKISSNAYGSTGRSTIQLGQNVLDQQLKRGLNVIAVDKDGKLSYRANIDLCAENKTPRDTIASVTKGEPRRYIIVASDSVYCSRNAAFTRTFEGSGLKEWKNIGFRHPYIAVIDGQKTFEYLGRMFGSVVATTMHSHNMAAM